MVVSFATCPAILFLASRLVSMAFALILIGAFAVSFTIISIRERISFAPRFKYYQPIIVAAGAWVLIVLILLVDFQWNQQLYFSVVSYDLTSRVSVVDAITRTGVPPVNPGYFPGHPVRLTFLYYFWYILTSLIDTIGGKWVSARTAQFASSAWCGLGLLAMLALYIRLRDSHTKARALNSIRTSMWLLTISGLDVIPVSIMMGRAAMLFFDIEHWNTQITAWIGSLLWVPHHVAALIAGLTAMLVVLHEPAVRKSRTMWAAVIAGLGFASAVGLSVWVTLIFAGFWGTWLIALLLQRTQWARVVPLVLAAPIALLLASPFLIDFFTNAGPRMGSFLIEPSIRSFYPLEPLAEAWREPWGSLLMFTALPVNYFFELGFYFIAGLLWLRTVRRQGARLDDFHLAEILLLSIVLFATSLFRSTGSTAMISTNDFGWRAWLPGQFILLVWGKDVLESTGFSKEVATPSGLQRAFAPSRRISILLLLLVLGFFTTTLDLLCLRLAWPLNAGREFAQEIYAARQAYDFLRDEIPSSVITQSNPAESRDRPSGLYGTHQMVIADRAAYEIPASDYQAIVVPVAEIFDATGSGNWNSIDAACERFGIQVLIFKDSDPIWRSIDRLTDERAALYANSHYAVFNCGEYALKK